MMDISRHGNLDEEIQFIQKPFSREDLAIMVRMVLEKLKDNSWSNVTNSDLRVILCWNEFELRKIVSAPMEGIQIPLQQ
jgi:hypothetical protein